MLDRPDDRVGAETSSDGALTPNNNAAEQALLGACLINAAALDRVATLVDAEDFFEPAHEAIFSAMRRRRDAGGSIDIRLVAVTLGELAHVDLGGMTVSRYVAQLAAEATTVVNAPDYAREIRTFADRRRAISTGLTILEVAKRDGCDPRALVEDAIAELDAIAVSRDAPTERQVSIEQAAESAYRAAVEVRAGNRKAGITTGLRDLNKALSGGWREGEITVLGGRPGMGKTTVATSMLVAAARAGYGGYMASLEMDEEQVGVRALSSVAYARGVEVPYKLLREGGATDDEMAAIDEARSSFRDMPIQIEQKGGLTIQQIAARARLVANRFAAKGQKLSLLVVDHLGLVKPSSRYAGNRYAEMTELTGTLKALAKELGVHVLALAQLNRQVETRDDKRPRLSDLRESGSIEQDADNVIFAYREAYYLEQTAVGADDDGATIARLDEVQNQLELIIAKQRMGPTRTIRAFCKIACNHLADLEQRSFV